MSVHICGVSTGQHLGPSFIDTPSHSQRLYTRCNRSGKNVTRRHVLTLNTPLPPQKIVLNVTHNKKQLITSITEYLVHHVANSFRNELIITPEHRIPIAIKKKWGNKDQRLSSRLTGRGRWYHSPSAGISCQQWCKTRVCHQWWHWCVHSSRALLL